MKKKVISALILTFLVINYGSILVHAESKDSKSGETEAASEIEYVKDEVVNTFINAYNKNTQYPFDELEEGNIRTKYHASSYGYWFELTHESNPDKINIRIDETNDTAEAGVPGMRDAFYCVAKAIDPSLSDDEIYAYFDQLVNNEFMVTDDEFSSMVVQYFPDKELSNGHSRGHIEISALSF